MGRLHLFKITCSGKTGHSDEVMSHINKHYRTSQSGYDHILYDTCYKRNRNRNSRDGEVLIDDL